MSYIKYQTTEGDRADIIAWKMYGDPYAYEGIVRANPGVSFDPVMNGGINIIVPILEVSPVHAALVPW